MTYRNECIYDIDLGIIFSKIHAKYFNLLFQILFISFSKLNKLYNFSSIRRISSKKSKDIRQSIICLLNRYNF